MNVRRIVRSLGAGLAALAAAAVLASCGSQGGPGTTRAAASARTTAAATTSAAGAASTPAASAAPAPAPPLVQVDPPAVVGASWQLVARVKGSPAVWEEQRGSVTLLRFDQRAVRLDLHAGAGEPEGSWRYGAQIEPSELHRVIAAFNGGFKFTTGDVGWMEQGRVGEPLKAGRGSIVTYADGSTAIGAWEQGVPAPNRPVFSVLQNLTLLVDGGQPAANAEGCILSCWGGTVGNATVVARSGLGIRSDGQLVWAAGEHLTPLRLAEALVGAGAQRAVQLDINPDWVAAYLYRHTSAGPVWTQVLPDQIGVAGKFLQAYSRDFFAVVAR